MLRVTMAKSYEREGLYIESAERLNNSANGNPRWRLYLRPVYSDELGFNAVTQSDAGCNYDVTNYLADRHGSTTVLTVRFTAAGRVSGLTPTASLKTYLLEGDPQ